MAVNLTGEHCSHDYYSQVQTIATHIIAYTYVHRSYLHERYVISIGFYRLIWNTVILAGDRRQNPKNVDLG